MLPAITTAVKPIPGTKKSLKVRLPGLIISVFVPEPTGVKNGADAATQMAIPIATGLIPRVTAIGINKGVTRRTVDVFIIIFVNKMVTNNTKNRNKNLFGS